MKPALLEYLKSHLDARMNAAFEAMQAAQNSANQETKSSAGDKYETGRAMAQIERDRHAQLYDQIRQERTILERIDINYVFERVGLGALIQTSAGIFFIAVSVGTIEIVGEKVVVVSPQSPLGASLMGRQKGDDFLFQQKKHVVHQII
ncbi:MAG: transcription elongation factor [Spirosomataceae bacterium]